MNRLQQAALCRNLPASHGRAEPNTEPFMLPREPLSLLVDLDDTA